MSYQESIIVRRWGVGVPLPLAVRENNEGDFEFANDPESANADVVLHRDDAKQVAEWLLRSLEPHE